MVGIPTQAEGPAICALTAKAGVFTQYEVDTLAEMWQEYDSAGSEATGYEFIVERTGGGAVAGYACYGLRNAEAGIYDLYYIAVDPDGQRSGVGRRLADAVEQAVRAGGGRMVIAETSATSIYDSARAFYAGLGYRAEATISDFYKPGDDLVIFVKRLA